MSTDDAPIPLHLVSEACTDGGAPPDATFEEIATAVGAGGVFDANPPFALSDSARDAVAATVAAARREGVGDGYPTFGGQNGQGQVATPPEIVAPLVRWALPPPAEEHARTRPPRVLDPAAGSGRFLLSAYRRLGAVAPGADHVGRLRSLVACERERPPAALATLALATLGEGTADVSVHAGSFFDLDPRTVGPVDAVVGNPPYVRQEDLVDPDRLRDHLRAFGRRGSTPYADGDRALSRRCDAYVYFVTRATQFLREGGRLAMVLPTKWLSTRYGASFQGFLFDHYRVHAVCGLADRPFDDALVDACLLLAERRTAPEDRAGATRFVRVPPGTAPGAALATITADRRPDGGRGAVETAETVEAPQSALARRSHGKLGHYLSAPPALASLLDADAMVPLGDLAEVSRGVMTGANDVFFLDGADARAIDGRFRRPAVKSIRGMDRRVLDGEGTERWLLAVHEYVEAVARRTGSDADGAASLETRVKRALAADGYDGLLAHLARAEREGVHERRSCRTREVWFDLGPLDPPAVLHPKFFDRRFLAVWNRDGVVPGNAVDCLDVHADVDERLLLGALNATLHEAVLECWGRTEGGGALQVMTYELRTVPVLDVRALDGATAEAIREGLGALLDGEADGHRRLDVAVLGALGTELSVDRLRSMRRTLTARRVDGSGPGRSDGQ